MWKTSLDSIQTFSKFISQNTEAKFGKLKWRSLLHYTIPFQFISLRWDQIIKLHAAEDFAEEQLEEKDHKAEEKLRGKYLK